MWFSVSLPLCARRINLLLLRSVFRHLVPPSKGFHGEAMLFQSVEAAACLRACHRWIDRVASSDKAKIRSPENRSSYIDRGWKTMPRRKPNAGLVPSSSTGMVHFSAGRGIANNKIGRWVRSIAALFFLYMFCSRCPYLRWSGNNVAVEFTVKKIFTQPKVKNVWRRHKLLLLFPKMNRSK